MLLRIKGKKGISGTAWVVIAILVILVFAFVYLKIFVPPLDKGAQSSMSCRGKCSNKIIERLNQDKEFIGYEDLRTCDEVNRHLKSNTYTKDTYGECSSGYECCVGFGTT